MAYFLNRPIDWIWQEEDRNGCSNTSFTNASFQWSAHLEVCHDACKFIRFNQKWTNKCRKQQVAKLTTLTLSGQWTDFVRCPRTWHRDTLDSWCWMRAVKSWQPAEKNCEWSHQNLTVVVFGTLTSFNATSDENDDMFMCWCLFHSLTKVYLVVKFMITVCYRYKRRWLVISVTCEILFNVTQTAPQQIQSFFFEVTMYSTRERELYRFALFHNNENHLNLICCQVE